jgi:hypothetical protein
MGVVLMIDITIEHPELTDYMRNWHKMQLVKEIDLALKPFWTALRNSRHYRYTLSRLSWWNYSREWLLEHGFDEDLALTDFLTEKQWKMFRYLKRKFKKIIESEPLFFEEPELLRGIAIIDEILRLDGKEFAASQ